MMRAVLKSLVIVAASVLLLGLGVYLASRAVGPSAEEARALALLDRPQHVGDRDGSAALYTLDLDMPDAEREPLLAADVARFAAAQRDGQGRRRWRSGREHWPVLGRSGRDDPKWCHSRDSGCLQQVRAAPEDYAALLDRDRELVDRVEALLVYDHFQNRFPFRPDMPLPSYQWSLRPLTRNALRFATGEVDLALAGTCKGITQGRVLIDAGDNLIGSMLGVALVRGHGELLASMLAELPRTYPLPDACAAALSRPLQTQQATCRAMTAEGRWSVSGMRQIVADTRDASAGIEGMFGWVVLDGERSAARIAPRFTWFCGDHAAALVESDAPLVDPSGPPSPWSLACVSNLTGCILIDIAAPAYVDYGLRLQDSEASLRTLSALLWLRARPGPIDADALAALPVDMTSAARPLRLDAEGATLGTPLYSHREKQSVADDVWRIPLPGSRLQPAPAAP